MGSREPDNDLTLILTLILTLPLSPKRFVLTLTLTLALALALRNPSPSPTTTLGLIPVPYLSPAPISTPSPASLVITSPKPISYAACFCLFFLGLQSQSAVCRLKSELLTTNVSNSLQVIFEDRWSLFSSSLLAPSKGCWPILDPKAKLKNQNFIGQEQAFLFTLALLAVIESGNLQLIFVD